MATTTITRPAARLLIFLLAFLFPILMYAQGRDQRQDGNATRQPAAKQATPGNRANAPAARPAGNNVPPKNSGKVSGGNRTNVSTGNKTNVSGGDRTNVSTGNKTSVSGNNVNIDNSRKNVNVNNSKNINVNNNRNTTVIVNPRPYTSPPYSYGGHHYYAYQPYRYHPYQPYHYGPAWHPWGFFVAAVAATAIIIAVENQKYHYDQGVYYVPSNGGYTVVQAPVGATITTLPPGTQTVVINQTTNNYYYAGTYYEKNEKGYTVVPPTSGTIVETLPEGGKEVKIGDVTYVQVGDTYYQPTQKDGKDVYEVVAVKEVE